MERALQQLDAFKTPDGLGNDEVSDSEDDEEEEVRSCTCCLVERMLTWLSCVMSSAGKEQQWQKRLKAAAPV